MAKINNITSYPISTPVTGSDIVIGSITGSGGDTANFLMSGIATYMTGQISLANVCSVGSTTATTMDIADTLTLSKPTGTGLQVDADANIDGTLEVAQTATFQLGVMIDNAGLAVMGSGGIIVGSTSGITSFGPISGISLNSTGGLLVSGTSLLGAIDAAGVADIADTLTLSKATGTGLQVDANANISGRLDVYGNIAANGFLDIVGGLKFSSPVPSTSSSSGSAGTFAVDTTHIYVCTATNTWGRVAIDMTPF